MEFSLRVINKGRKERDANFAHIMHGMFAALLKNPLIRTLYLPLSALSLFRSLSLLVKKCGR